MARFWLWATMLATVTLCGCGGNSPQKTNRIADREITLSEEAFGAGISDTLQLGRMRQGEIIAKTIRLHNGSDRPVVILREVTSCGCTMAQYLRQPIAPASSCDITIEFNSQGQLGWQMKLMEFYFAEKATPLKIYIDAEVE
jgi:hypothetical protein